MTEYFAITEKLYHNHKIPMISAYVSEGDLELAGGISVFDSAFN
jgi:hypothetical protein